MRKWDKKGVDYFLTTRYSVPNLVFLLFKPSIFWSSLPNLCRLETWREEPNFCFKMSKMAAAIRYSPFSGVLAGSKTCRKHCLIGEICSNCLLCCMMMAVSLASIGFFATLQSLHRLRIKLLIVQSATHIDRSRQFYSQKTAVAGWVGKNIGHVARGDEGG